MKKNNSGVTPLQPGKLLYLAYGSNMSSARMLHRCPRAKWRGKTYIKDWLL